jgi:hypothetical protein
VLSYLVCVRNLSLGLVQSSSPKPVTMAAIHAVVWNIVVVVVVVVVVAFLI